MKVNWIIFIILLILGVIFGVIYLVYCHLKKQQCVVCGTNDSLMDPPKTDVELQNNDSQLKY